MTSNPKTKQGEKVAIRLRPRYTGPLLFDSFRRAGLFIPFERFNVQTGQRAMPQKG